MTMVLDQAHGVQSGGDREGDFLPFLQLMLHS